MKCCRTCKFIDSDFERDHEDINYGKTYYFCGCPVVLPEVMIGSLLDDIIDDPDQYGGDCDCYQLDKSRK